MQPNPMLTDRGDLLLRWGGHLVRGQKECDQGCPVQQSTPRRRPREGAAVGSLGQGVGGLCRSELPRGKEDGESAKGTFQMQASWGPELHGDEEGVFTGAATKSGSQGWLTFRSRGKQTL